MTAFDLFLVCGTLILCAGSVIGAVNAACQRVVSELRAIRGAGPR